MKKLSAFVLVMFLVYSFVQAQTQSAHFKISEPCNVRIKDSAGNYLRPDSAYFWKGFMGTAFPDFPCNGVFSIKLEPGKYYYELDRGPEYYLTKGDFTIIDKNLTLNLILKRMVDVKKMKWWSGEMHIHRKVKDIELLMKASDIHVGPVITSWNEHYSFNRTDTVFDFSVKKFDGDRYYSVTGSEDERNGGAILVLNSSKPINYSVDHRPEYPPLARSVREVRDVFKDSAWIDIEKPFWQDVPVLLATGRINSLGIAHNHMNQGGVFDNEAWGKERDKNKYPFPKGNGLYTQDVYYHVLNSGLRIPPSAGSASGVLLNPVGYNRVYAYVNGDMSYEKWFDAVRQGKTFISNGPLLICRADGQLAGNVFSAEKKKDIKISGEVLSRDTLESIEIIKNGEVYKTISPATLKVNKFSSVVSFDKSGWFLIRVICTTSNNFRFASTAPFYVEMGDEKKLIRRMSAQFFLDWTNERAKSIKADNEKELKEIMGYVDAARKYWGDIVSTATEE